MITDVVLQLGQPPRLSMTPAPDRLGNPFDGRPGNLQVLWLHHRNDKAEGIVLPTGLVNAASMEDRAGRLVGQAVELNGQPLAADRYATRLLQTLLPEAQGILDMPANAVLRIPKQALLMPPARNRIESLGALGERLTRDFAAVHGWYLAASQAYPLRLIADSGTLPRLDHETWTPAVGAGVDPATVLAWGGRIRVTSPFCVMDKAKSLNVMAKVLIGDKDAGIANDLQAAPNGFSLPIDPPRPMLVNYQGQKTAIVAVTVHWGPKQNPGAEPDVVGVTITLELAAPTALPVPALQPAALMPGAVKKWLTDKDGEEWLEVVPANNSGWRLPREQASLLCRPLLAGVSSQHGLYVTYKEGDVLQVLLTDGGIPTALGGAQIRTLALEKIDDQDVALHLHAMEGHTAVTSPNIDWRFTGQMTAGEQGKVMKASANEVTILDKSARLTPEEVTLLNTGAVVKPNEVTLAGKVKIE